MEKSDMYGWFKLYFDYDMNTWMFFTYWNDCHKQSRAVTEEQAEIIKDILMGGHVETRDQKG